MTGFTNTEEVAVGKEKLVPFALEDRLKELGAEFERGPDWGVHAVRCVVCVVSVVLDGEELLLLPAAAAAAAAAAAEATCAAQLGARGQDWQWQEK